MKRALPIINLAGVLLVAVLCGLQWRANRQANLVIIRLEKARLAHEQKIAEQEKALASAAADLDQFRNQLSATAASLKSAEDKARGLERSQALLTSERDQLNESIGRWSEALAERDAQLRQAGEQMQSLAAERNAAVEKFNALALQYNTAVTNLNQRTLEFNQLVEKYNSLAEAAQ